MANWKERGMSWWISTEVQKLCPGADNFGAAIAACTIFPLHRAIRLRVKKTPVKSNHKGSRTSGTRVRIGDAYFIQLERQQSTSGLVWYLHLQLATDALSHVIHASGPGDPAPLARRQLIFRVVRWLQWSAPKILNTSKPAVSSSASPFHINPYRVWPAMSLLSNSTLTAPDTYFGIYNELSKYNVHLNIFERLWAVSQSQPDRQIANANSRSRVGTNTCKMMSSRPES
jgi:hypothetical protein